MTELLLVDKDPDFTAGTAEYMRTEGFGVRVANSLHEARNAVLRAAPQILVTDWRLPDGSGLDLLERTDCTHLPTVVVTDSPSVESAIAGLRKGVNDYLIKPVDPPRLKACLEQIRVTVPAVRAGHPYDSGVRGAPRPGLLVGQTPAMRRLHGLLEKIAPTEASVMLYGESGTGKELAARTIHELSGASGPLLALNCAAMPQELIGNELFGHEKGGFTGATGQHRGYFERAMHGTLLLDEITEMPLDLQAYLLRVLETRKVIRVGGTREIDVDVRLIAATNQSLEAAVGEKKLREDLYYRLAVFPIRLPPLRERKPDIPLLVEHFLNAINREDGTAKTLHPQALDALIRYHWPGNVRELRNWVQRAFLLAADQITEQDCNACRDLRLDDPQAGTGDLRLQTGTTLKEAERRLILQTLVQCEGNKRLAARSLGVSLKTLYNKLKGYDVTPYEQPDASRRH